MKKETRKTSDAELAVKAAANKLAADTDTDILIYDGQISRTNYRYLVNLCQNRLQRKNIVLHLFTLGGDPNAAYRIGRYLQSKYSQVSVFVSDNCKSAGSLLCVAAHELIMDDVGELGPLDIQVQKPDELYETSSGLNLMNALSISQAKAYAMLEDCLVNLKLTSEGQITLKTALENASKLAIGLFGKIYEQIDPITLGEISRSMKIAEDYGERLNRKSRNLKKGALEKLIAKYPAHDFAIDRLEAKELFESVRVPEEVEEELVAELKEYLDEKKRVRPNRVVIEFLNEQNAMGDTNGQKDRKGDSGRTQTTGGANQGSGSARATGG